MIKGTESVGNLCGNSVFDSPQNRVRFGQVQRESREIWNHSGNVLQQIHLMHIFRTKPGVAWCDYGIGPYLMLRTLKKAPDEKCGEWKARPAPVWMDEGH